MRYFLTCPRCAAPVSENQKFCTKCGLNFELEFKKIYPPEFVSKYESIFKKIETQGPDDKLYTELAQMFADKDKHREAVLYFERALSLNNENYTATVGCAISYMKLNHTPKAEYLLHKAIQLKPQSNEPIELLFYLYSNDEKKYEQAVQLAEKILKFKTDDPDFLKRLKKIYLSLSQYQKAKQIIYLLLEKKDKLKQDEFKQNLKELLFVNLKLLPENASKDDYREALDIANKLYTVTDDPELSIYKLFVFTKSDDYKKALDSFENVEQSLPLIVNPNLILMLSWSTAELSKFYRKNGNLALSKKFAEISYRYSKNPEFGKTLAKAIFSEAIEQYNNSKFEKALLLLYKAKMYYNDILKDPEISIEEKKAIEKTKRKVFKRIRNIALITALYLIAVATLLFDFNLWLKSKEIKKNLQLLSTMSTVMISENLLNISKITINGKEYSKNEFEKFNSFHKLLLEPNDYKIYITPTSNLYNDTVLNYELKPGEFVYIDFTPSKKPPRFGVITGSNVILRSYHSIESDILSRLNKDTHVEILERWTAEDPNEAITTREIYLQTPSLRVLLNRGKAVKIVAEQGSYYTVTCEYQGRIIRGILPKNVVEKTYGQTWFKIKTNDGKVGWVFGKFLQEQF